MILSDVTPHGSAAAVPAEYAGLNPGLMAGDTIALHAERAGTVEG